MNIILKNIKLNKSERKRSLQISQRFDLAGDRCFIEKYSGNYSNKALHSIKWSTIILINLKIFKIKSLKI